MDGYWQKHKRFLLINTIYHSFRCWCDNEHINNFIPFFGCFSTIYIQEDKMDARLKHIEDIEADNRALMVKLIKQSNSIVQFLAQIDLEADDHIMMEDMGKLPPIENKIYDSEKTEKLKELIDEFMTKQKDLKEFEKELKKYKDDITPGQIGES